jgi:hypothetical protein
VDYGCVEWGVYVCLQCKCFLVFSFRHCRVQFHEILWGRTPSADFFPSVCLILVLVICLAKLLNPAPRPQYQDEPRYVSVSLLKVAWNSVQNKCGENQSGWQYVDLLDLTIGFEENGYAWCTNMKRDAGKAIFEKREDVIESEMVKKHEDVAVESEVVKKDEDGGIGGICGGHPGWNCKRHEEVVSEVA